MGARGGAGRPTPAQPRARVQDGRSAGIMVYYKLCNTHTRLRCARPAPPPPHPRPRPRPRPRPPLAARRRPPGARM
ncbi:hypothetical protein E2C01_009766 [Portunus trituberculatus]|uniref:Uncharacterized protein n=1 Tax=Portunus trituberculatus TaxID=210409 RepID=A0A5B7D6W5_PORTR|nr:hypothetical protein [Portunus trituberculatus]